MGEKMLGGHREAVKLVVNLVVWSAAVPASFWLRVDDPVPRYLPHILLLSAVGLAAHGLLTAKLGLHRQAWRSVGVRDLLAVLKAAALSALVLAIASFVANPYLQEPVPRSIPLIAAALGVLAMGGMRLLVRLVHEARGRVPAMGAKRVLVVGAGEAGSIITREMIRHPEAGLLPVGFLDDAPAKRHQTIAGVPVLGPISDLPAVVQRVSADEVLLAIPSAPGPVVRRVLELARSTRVSHRIIPGIYEILAGKVDISQIREVDVEDLLRREPVALDLGEIASYLRDRCVLVTGAGGSIGSEIARQVARFGPRRLVLLGRGESSIFQIDRDMERAWPELERVAVIADVRDRIKLEHVFGAHRPEVVFHAAAHKHVPLMEASPDEAVLNNVFGTVNVVEVARQYGAGHFVNISTDKAVNPTSVMGASKRVAEEVVTRAARAAHDGQVFVSVRFGNVLGSRGSVVPIFKEQIRLGGPVTVTDARMMRYFMTTAEAAQLVLQAGGMRGNGALYVLEMGEPVSVYEMARDLIRLSGLEPGVDIEIVLTGARPGEKLHEELLTAEEGTAGSRHERIYVALDRSDGPGLDANLAELHAAALARDGDRIRAALKASVPTYHPGAAR